MKTHNLAIVAIALTMLLCSCQPSVRTLELSVPLQAPADVQANPVSALDVLVAVETVAAHNGLKPYIEQTEDDDILGLADIDEAAGGNIRTWRHPDLPIYLTATRHKNEVVLLLNTPADAPKNPKAQKLFATLKTQLIDNLSPFLTPSK